MFYTKLFQFNCFLMKLVNNRLGVTATVVILHVVVVVVVVTGCTLSIRLILV